MPAPRPANKDGNGNPIPAAEYYPFGGLRPGSGPVTKTDKHFTGQQDQATASDTQATLFGLYNYGARFYSATLGRFLSADPALSPGDPQMLDRYSYVHNSPLNYIDPSGLHLVVVCGTGQKCEGVNARLSTIRSYKEWIMLYWHLYEGIPADMLELRYAWFQGYLSHNPTSAEELLWFDVAVLSTSEDGLNVFNHDPYVNKVSDFLESHPSVDTLVGFSLGAHVAAEVLAGGRYGNVQRAVLIEKANKYLGDYQDLPSSVGIVTLNHYDATGCLWKICGDMRGTNNGIVNIDSFDDPQGHGNFGQNPDVVFFALAITTNPREYIGHWGNMTVSMAPLYVPRPEPVPMP